MWSLAIVLLILFVLAVNGAGWYYLFKRFERRMSARFDDLAKRSDEALKSFADVLETLGTIINRVDVKSQDVAERIQRVKIDIESLAGKAVEADKKLDLIQGIALVIKQDKFLDAVGKSLSAARNEAGMDEEALKKIEALIEELKLENYSKY